MTSDGVNSFVWNARNQLASMNLGSVSFQYDPFGRRVGKTISGSTTNYLYDGVNLAQELSGGVPTANLLSGGLDEVFTRTDAAGSRQFLVDAQGSTLALSDSTGTLQTQYTYEPFGNTTAAGAASGNPFQYTGRENDGTGLYFYRARYYSPALQRFVSEDPLGLAANSVNFYELAYDSPMNFVDPLGMQPTTVEALPAPAPAPPAPDTVAPPAPSPVSPPAPPSTGVGVGIGNLLAAIGVILTSPMDLNPNEPDPATFPRDNPLPGRAKSGNKGKWYCKVRCALLTAPGGEGVGQYEAEAYGNTAGEAVRNAMTKARNSPPRGFQAKHCHVIRLERR
jgi:RHS repeat-associated protein